MYLFLGLLLISSIFPQCDDFSQIQCNYDESCNWIENIESGDCSDWSYNNTYNYNQCNAIDACEWSSYQIDCGTATGYSDCDISAGCSYSWLTYTCSGWTTVSECSGGYYEIDNGDCVEIPECNELDDSNECNQNDDCEWIEDFSNQVNCDTLTVNQCGEYNDFGCNVEQYCSQWGSWYTWICYEYSYQCTGGWVDIDNGYCQDAYLLGDLNIDESINIMDVVAVINIILDDTGYNFLADMNYDNQIDILDVVLIVEFILNDQ